MGLRNRLRGLYLLVLVGFVALVGCQDNEIDSLPMLSADGVTIVASTASQTRVSLSDNAEQQAIQATWSAGDSFSLYDEWGSYVGRFDYAGEDGATQGEFVANCYTSFYSGSTYTAMYPYFDGDEYLTLDGRKALVTADVTTQSQDANISHLNSALRMSSEFTYSDDTTPITFAHDLAILKVYFSLTDGATPTQLTFSDGDVDYTLNYSEEITTTTSYTSYTSYLPILPSPTDSGERELGFSLTTSAGGDPLTYSTSVAYDLEAGRCYTANITTYGAAIRTLADFSSTDYPTDTDIWSITDSTAELDAFYGLRNALYEAYDEGREISLIFPNLEAVPTASSNTLGAFYDCDALVSADLPLVTSVGDFAFRNCSFLSSIDLPLVTSVGSYAFSYCNSLSSIDMPLVTSVGSYAFSDCSSLSSIDLPLATSVGSWAFYGCSSLSSIDLPLVTSVGSGAFFFCSALTDVSLATGDGVQLSYLGYLDSSWGVFPAFSDASTENITLTLGTANSELVSGNTLTVGDVSETFKEIILADIESYSTLADFSSTSYPADTNTWVVTDTSGEISDFYGLRDALYAAEDEGRKISLEFPNLLAVPSPSESTNGAFYNCQALVSLSLPNATSVGNFVCYLCESLESVYAPQSNSFGWSSFCYCYALTTADTSSATYIENYAFCMCNNLTSVDLSNAQTINTYAFYSCSNLESVDLSSAQTIGDRAFYSCYNLASVDLSSVQTIGGLTFFNCDGFTSITLPSSLYSLGYAAFNASSNLTDFVCNSPYYTLENGLIYSSDKSTIVSALCELAVGAISDDAVTTILTDALSFCDLVTSFSFYNATTIGLAAFETCTAVETITLPSASTIDSYAFYGCDALTTLSLATDDNAQLSSIGGDYSAFYEVDTSNISLQTGFLNISYVDGNTFTVGDFSATFSSITIFYPMAEPM